MDVFFLKTKKNGFNHHLHGKSDSEYSLFNNLQ